MSRKLPAPRRTGPLSLEEALEARRSVREFAPTRLSLPEVSQLLWATQGVTSEDGKRTCPSAGALYPLEVYVATEEGLDYHEPFAHTLSRVTDRDLRSEMRAAAFDQACITSAPCVVVFAAVYERTCSEYGDMGRALVLMDAGHAAQNLLLQAEALHLAGVPVAAFDPDRLASVLSLPSDQEPVYLVPIGRTP